jgi:hypothetical protein
MDEELGALENDGQHPAMELFRCINEETEDSADYKQGIE